MNENSLKIRGDVWMKISKDHLTREQVLENPDRQYHNLIVDVCSNLIASWAYADSSPTVPGILSLAVGTGDVGWDLQNPPAETAGLIELYAELIRKPVVPSYVSPPPSNVVDFTTTFDYGEANGALVEMGLFGGVGALGAGGGIRVNAKHFPVINKRHDSTLTILWELTF